LTHESGSEIGREIWRKFLRRHWTMLVVFGVGILLVSAGAILVFLWVVGDAQSHGLVPTTLDLWTMGHIVTFLVRLVFWEVLLVGIPTILAAVGVWQWWKRLPGEEKAEYHFFEGRSRATSGGGGSISFLVFIAFCIKVYTDGNWNVAVATWTLDYLVYSWLTALLWVLAIVGIPIALGVIWWIRHETEKNP